MKIVTIDDKHTLYFNEGDIFSNSYICNIIAYGKKFNCAEQLLQYKKALLFNDNVMADKIQRSLKVKDQIVFGNNIKDFDQDLWNAHKHTILYEVIEAKFNSFASKVLLDTYSGCNFVFVPELSKDTLLGVVAYIGNMQEGVPEWKGANLLGNTLTEYFKH